jgi:hypothetical protein
MKDCCGTVGMWVIEKSPKHNERVWNAGDDDQMKDLDGGGYFLDIGWLEEHIFSVKSDLHRDGE